MSVLAEKSAASQDPTSEAHALVEWFDGFDKIMVAFSGGVDSSVVLAAAIRSNVADVTAVTAVSPSVPRWQRELAAEIAEELEARHQFVETEEVMRDDYAQNDPSRCYHCKETLYQSLDQVVSTTESLDGTFSDQGSNTRGVIVSGTNADDLGDHRPGIQAGRRAGVRTPLAELGLGKDLVRSIARSWQLSNWQLPASPCLASRIAYGVRVTPERLAMIENAEDWFRMREFSDVRVRLHENELARVEVPSHEISRLLEPDLSRLMPAALREFGFRFITVDIEGLRSGSLNQSLSVPRLIQLGLKQP